jgi:hypothetical protein
MEIRIDMNRSKRSNLFCLWLALALLAGCATSQRDATEPKPDALRVSNVSVSDAMTAAEDVLGRMHFVIEKADPQRGLIRTKPLSGAQFLEFWRSDNVGAARALEANLHTLRRSVELRVRPSSDHLDIDCTVKVQRLSLPENEVPSVSQAYRMHSRSTPTIQRLELEPWQQEGLDWIDLGDDPLLAQRILTRIARNFQQGQEKVESE